MEKPSYLINDASDLDPGWLDGVETVGVTAGASAPEELVQGVIKQLAVYRDVQVQKMPGVEENVTFKLPRELTHSAHFTGTTS